ncbi:MAG TPA: dienelactone hydrolase, partial [Bacteroidales bacterium]|nr:dienelactone hydrolase [Bacteroidales bacterium]
MVGTLEVASNAAFLPSGDEGFENKPSVVEGKPARKALATPVARAMAKELGVDINQIRGTGPSGRVTTQDIENYIKKQTTTPSAAQSVTQVVETLGAQVEYENLTQIRKTIARNMTQSKHNAAHMSVFDEVEVSELVRIRSKYKSAFAEKGVKLSYLPFILRALAMSLKYHKVLNSQLDLDNNRIIYKKYYNIGIAVDT